MKCQVTRFSSHLLHNWPGGILVLLMPKERVAKNESWTYKCGLADADPPRFPTWFPMLMTWTWSCIVQKKPHHPPETSQLGVSLGRSFRDRNSEKKQCTIQSYFGSKWWVLVSKVLSPCQEFECHKESQRETQGKHELWKVGNKF